jgi:hypothetical protein
MVSGASGTVHTCIAKWLDLIPGCHNLQHLQKAVCLGPVGILRKILSNMIATMVLVPQQQNFACGTSIKPYGPD